MFFEPKTHSLRNTARMEGTVHVQCQHCCCKTCPTAPRTWLPKGAATQVTGTPGHAHSIPAMSHVLGQDLPEVSSQAHSRHLDRKPAGSSSLSPDSANCWPPSPSLRTAVLPSRRRVSHHHPRTHVLHLTARKGPADQASVPLEMAVCLSPTQDPPVCPYSPGDTPHTETVTALCSLLA